MDNSAPSGVIALVSAALADGAGWILCFMPLSQV